MQPAGPLGGPAARGEREREGAVGTGDVGGARLPGRRGLPGLAGLRFSLTWWSFTFPVGTVVTGTAGLAVTAGADFFVVAAVAFYVGLLLAWLVVATRTARGVLDGRLLR